MKPKLVKLSIVNQHFVFEFNECNLIQLINSTVFLIQFISKGLDSHDTVSGVRFLPRRDISDSEFMGGTRELDPWTELKRT